MLCIKIQPQSFAENWLGVSEEKSFKGVNGRMDGRQVITIADPDPSANVSQNTLSPATIQISMHISSEK